MSKIFSTTKACVILLVVVMVTRGSSFIFSKTLLENMEPMNVLGIRFLTGFMILCFLFAKTLRKITKNEFLFGCMIGVSNFFVMVFEMYALRITDASTTSFLEHTAIVMVPLFEAILTRTLPQKKVLLCDITTFVGVGFLSLGGASGFRLSTGEILCLFCALFYAISIIMMSRLSAKTENPINIGIIQIGVMGALSMIVSFVIESPRLPSTGDEWLYLLLLAILCTSFGFAMQPVAQAHISAGVSGMLAAINPLSTAILSVLILNETLTGYEIFGAVLILLSIVLLSLLPVGRHTKSDFTSSFDKR